MVTCKATKAIAGLGYAAEMYNVAWNVLFRNFGKPQMVVKAQLKRIYSFPPVKPYDGAALIEYARIVSSCVNVLTQFNYVGDLNSEGVLGSATRKFTLNMKTKWLTYVKQMNLDQPGLVLFSEWLNHKADVQDELLLSSLAYPGEPSPQPNSGLFCQRLSLQFCPHLHYQHPLSFITSLFSNTMSFSSPLPPISSLISTTPQLSTFSPHPLLPLMLLLLRPISTNFKQFVS